MLALAQDYAEELIKKERETWEDKKYWYYNCSSYMHPIEVDANTWERTQLVSLNDSVFSVIIGNPIEPKYDRLIEHYGGRIVGINKEHVMLPDGELYDMKFYEIFRTDYLEHRKNVKSAG